MNYRIISADCHIDMTWMPGDLWVKNAPAKEYKVTWGTETKTFNGKELADGILLPARFAKSPFDDAFKRLDEAVDPGAGAVVLGAELAQRKRPGVRLHNGKIRSAQCGDNGRIDYDGADESLVPDEDEVKKGLEGLYRKVEKHLTEEENLLQVR